MNRFALFVGALCVTCLPAFGRSGGHASHGVSQSKIVHVKPYTTKNGKQVAGHDRTAPNSTQKDNWSAKGNSNPETGKAGTKTVTK
jgi:hypothetical protein